MRRTLRAAAAALAGSAAVACGGTAATRADTKYTSDGSKPAEACTADLRPGLAVTLRDSVTGAPITLAGTVVVARDGAYADTARLGTDVRPELKAIPLASERAGTYTVHVERAGYKAWDRAGVPVAAAGCHVRTTAVTAVLQPAAP